MSNKNYAEGLPSICYSILPSTKEVIIIKRGETGYWKADTNKSADELNAELEITKAQAEAMLVGSMFGWHVDGADPANYDETGKFISK